jgi:hypothetical protein
MYYAPQPKFLVVPPPLSLSHRPSHARLLIHPTALAFAKAREIQSEANRICLSPQTKAPPTSASQDFCATWSKGQHEKQCSAIVGKTSRQQLFFQARGVSCHTNSSRPRPGRYGRWEGRWEGRPRRVYKEGIRDCEDSYFAFLYLPSTQISLDISPGQSSA